TPVVNPPFLQQT
nr:RecName: Full=Bioactive peptide 1; Short=BAP1 [Latilactobacillus curvatus]